MQVDWGEAAVYLGGQRMTANLFCARLCYSCAPFVMACYRQNLESFLDGLTRAIRFFGGVPRQVIFDNTRVAVKAAAFPLQKTLDEFDMTQLNPLVSPVFLRELASCSFI